MLSTLEDLKVWVHAPLSVSLDRYACGHLSMQYTVCVQCVCVRICTSFDTLSVNGLLDTTDKAVKLKISLVSCTTYAVLQLLETECKILLYNKKLFSYLQPTYRCILQLSDHLLHSPVVKEALQLDSKQ